MKQQILALDKKENIEAGLKQGWNAHVFTTTRELLIVND